MYPFSVFVNIITLLYYCFSWAVKRSGDFKSRGVKLLPGKENTSKFSISKYVTKYTHVHSRIYELMIFLNIKGVGDMTKMLIHSNIIYHNIFVRNSIEKWVTYSIKSSCGDASFFFFKCSSVLVTWQMKSTSYHLIIFSSHLELHWL